MNYGYFDDENREYVITNPKTPVKWINYIGTIEFGGFVDNTGGSLICKKDPALNRIIKYIPQLPQGAFNGETMYIRLKNKDIIKLYSPYFVPTLDSYDFYQCRVGTGYSKILTEFYGIRTETIIFVPMGFNCEIRYTKVTNKNLYPVNLDMIPVVEYTHFDALKQLTNADWVPQTMQSEIYEDKYGFKILKQFAFMNKDLKVNYFTSNLEVTSFESERDSFLGDYGYGTWQAPCSLNNYELGNHEAKRGDNIGALMHHLGNLNSNESKVLITQLGQCEAIEDEIKNINYFRNEENVKIELSKLKEFWNDYLGVLKLETPDENMNRMISIYNSRQCYITKNWSRYLSLYQLGFGARGIGFRDSSQDVMGVIINSPEEGKELIEKLLSMQKIDGSALHQFNPLTMEGSIGDSKEMEDRYHYYSDDHLWIILAVCSYLKYSGDMDFLNKSIEFYDKDKGGKAIEVATVFEHMKRAIKFTSENIGNHGLPLLGFADWNDTVNLKKGAESIFTACLYGKALLEIMELCDFLQYKEVKQSYMKMYEDMKARVNDKCFDGQWYIRYFDEKGEPLGSSKNLQGKIYVNSQSWSVISGFAEKEKAYKSMESVYKILNTKNGIKLSWPSFNKYDPSKGGITTYPPGAKENGGIFLHSNPWVIIAEAMLGNGDRAYEYYKEINPSEKNDEIQEYQCEPYCYAQNILGDEHTMFGLGRNSWLSGTASWAYQAAVNYIIGIKPSYRAFRIEPCIPKTWKGFNVKYKFKGCTYNIEVINKFGVNSGIKNIIVDGDKIKDNEIPLFTDANEHTVNIDMG